MLDLLGAVWLTACWSAIFFFASAAASAAYLTVGESFPLEARAIMIAFFFAVGTACGGIASPVLFGMLVGSGERGAVFAGYLSSAPVLMIAARGRRARCSSWMRSGKSLEEVARPLSAANGG